MTAGVDVNEECIYFCGNSLGLQPRNAPGEVEREMAKWSRKALYGHMTGEVPWYPIEDVAEASAKVVGCKTCEVTAMNSLTANIHFALVRIFTP